MHAGNVILILLVRLIVLVATEMEPFGSHVTVTVAFVPPRSGTMTDNSKMK